MICIQSNAVLICHSFRSFCCVNVYFFDLYQHFNTSNQKLTKFKSKHHYSLTNLKEYVVEAACQRRTEHLRGNFVEVGDAYNPGESASDGEKNLQSKLLHSGMASIELEGRINGILAPLSTQQETLIQSVMELNEGSSTRSTEKSIASDRSRSSGQRSDTRH